MNKLFKKKPLKSFSNDIQNTFNLISFNINEPELMGSSALSSIQYNNDYDLYEVIHKSKDINNAVKQVYNRFKKMINDIQQSDNIYFLDFKLGLDNDLIPTTSNIKAFYKEKYDKGLISKQQLDTILNAKENELDEQARQIYTLRWSPKEIQQGYKELSGSRREYFIDALQDKAIIKLDIVYYIYDQFIEFSNIFEIYYGNKTYMPSINILESLKDDMNDLIREGNYFKYLKRLFVLEKINKNEQMVNNLIDVFNSNLGLVYKIASQLKTMTEIIDKMGKSKGVPLDKMRNSLQFLKQQLSYVYEFNLPKDIYEKFDKMSKTKSIKSLYNQLVNMTELLMKKVNKISKKSLLK
jgi:hypothetical protein